MGILKDKVAIITGGGQGVGLGIATIMVREGARVVITGRTADKLETAAAGLRAEGGEVLCVTADVSSRDDAFRVVDETVRQFGRLDILVNNAQTSSPGTLLEDTSPEKVRLTLDSGLVGTLNHMQAAFPHLKVKGGSIINLGSREGIMGGVGFGIYAATKEGIRALSRVGAREWGKYNIRVNVICPAALTPIAVQYLKDNPEAADFYLKDIALGRFGDPTEDIGPVAAYLASDGARYVSGQTINADGGLVML